MRAMTRQQWKAAISPLLPTSRKERRGKARKDADEKQDGRIFEFAILTHPGAVLYSIKANTRSEARAILKRQLGLERLPVGCSIRAKPERKAA